MQVVRILLVPIAALITVPLLAATPLLQPGDVVLISYSSVICIFEPPEPVFGVSVIPRGGTVAAFSYGLTWRSYYTSSGAIAFSDRAGMIVSSDQTGYGNSILSVLHDDGSSPQFGAGVPYIYGIAPTSTDILVLAGGELWRLSASGELLARMPLPTPVLSSVDVASDQCTVFYTGRNAITARSVIARFDACRQVALSDFASTDDSLINVRIAPDGEVFAVAIDGRGNQLLRFSPDGQLLGSVSLPLITAENESITAFAFDQTGENLWVATSFRCLYTSGRLMLVERTTGRVLSAIQPETASPTNWFVALATVSEWRAALPRPSSRRHVVGH